MGGWTERRRRGGWKGEGGDEGGSGREEEGGRRVPLIRFYKPVRVHTLWLKREGGCTWNLRAARGACLLSWHFQNHVISQTDIGTRFFQC